MTNMLDHKPGDKLEVRAGSQWIPCIILSIATYVGKSGPGYYAGYDPASQSCASFWCNDRVLRRRTIGTH